MTERNNLDLLTMTTEIVVAGFANSTNLPRDDYVADLIKSIYGALESCGQPAAPAEPEFEPAISPRKSVTPDHIISLIDGSKHKMLKPHLTNNGLTPDEYRQRYGLASDYPMVAPNYAEKRRLIAIENGLGKVGDPKRGRKSKAA